MTPEWTELLKRYQRRKITVKKLHFYSTPQAVKTYGLLADAGYKCECEANYNAASFVTVFIVTM